MKKKNKKTFDEQIQSWWEEDGKKMLNGLEGDDVYEGLKEYLFDSYKAGFLDCCNLLKSKEQEKMYNYFLKNDEQ